MTCVLFPFVVCIKPLDGGLWNHSNGNTASFLMEVGSQLSRKVKLQVALLAGAWQGVGRGCSPPVLQGLQQSPRVTMAVFPWKITRENASLHKTMSAASREGPTSGHKHEKEKLGEWPLAFLWGLLCHVLVTLKTRAMFLCWTSWGALQCAVSGPTAPASERVLRSWGAGKKWGLGRSRSLRDLQRNGRGDGTSPTLLRLPGRLWDCIDHSLHQALRWGALAQTRDPQWMWRTVSSILCPRAKAGSGCLLSGHLAWSGSCSGHPDFKLRGGSSALTGAWLLLFGAFVEEAGFPLCKGVYRCLQRIH